MIWADASGRVIGGGFTTAAVPADWRKPAKSVSTVDLGDGLEAKVEVEVVTLGPGTLYRPDDSVAGTFDDMTIGVDTQPQGKVS